MFKKYYFEIVHILDRIPYAKHLILTLCILFYLPATYLIKTYEFVSNFYIVFRIIISAIFILIWFFTEFNKSKLEILLVLFIYLVLTVSTFLYGTRSYMDSLIVLLFNSVGFCMMIDYFMCFNPLLLIKSFRLAFEILVIINLLTIICFPQGLYVIDNGYMKNAAYFLGHKNNGIESMIPLIGLGMLETYIEKKKFTKHVIFLILISSISVILTGSVNAILCLLVYDLYIILFVLKLNIKISRLINARLFALASAIMSFLLIVVKITDKFKFILVNILGKDVTLTGRTFIWEKSLECIKASFLLGYGVESGGVKAAKIYMQNSCHNYYLDLLYYGGIIMLILVVLLFVRITSFKSQSKVQTIINEISSVMIGAYSLLWIATPIHRISLCWMLGIWIVIYGLNKYSILDT